MQKKNIWVKSIEQEIAKAPFKKFLWIFIAFIYVIIFYFVLNSSNAFIASPILFLVLIIGFFIVIAKIIESPKNPDYIAYYLYKIGDEFVDFEVETNYLKRNQKY